MSYIRNLILLLLFVQFYNNSVAQNYDPFDVRKNITLRGNMVVVGNTLVTISDHRITGLDNQDAGLIFIDIDSDSSTKNSSSADVVVPNHIDGSTTSCYKVAYAALYWGAFLQSGSRTDINKVKFKLPGSTTYTNITGEIIYDAIVNPIPGVGSDPLNTPYACYADVTQLVAGLTNVAGTYTVGNVQSSIGFNGSTGISAGWTLVVIYEDPSMQVKSFTTFDGFSYINGGHQTVVPVTGFLTPQVGNVDLQFAYATLDGDRYKRGTKLEINGKEVTTPFRPANNFFGSIIENRNGVAYPRNPNYNHTFGYDTGMLDIFNANPEYIKNNDTSADFRMQVAPGQADPIFAFFAALGVDVIAPELNLIKKVVNASGTNVNGTTVAVGTDLFYEITYQNTGTDNIDQLEITDVIPNHLIFNPSNIDFTNSGGASVKSYDATTRTLIISVPNSAVEVKDASYTIRIPVTVSNDCYEFAIACSKIIKNQAFANYTGVINKAPIINQPSANNANCAVIPQSTDFTVDISKCNLKRTVILCGPSVVLTAADGYDSYSWSTTALGIPKIGSNQSYTATLAGVYYVTSRSATCGSIKEEITVIPFGVTIPNPLTIFADEIVTCPNDGSKLPNIFLCGLNDFLPIQLGLDVLSSISWQKLDESSCGSSAPSNCANTNTGCSWDEVGTGSNFLVDTAGQFKVVIIKIGGCTSTFYFNVFQNDLEPTVTTKNIICTTKGKITVENVPTGYEYSLSSSGPYQDSNEFIISTPGYYTVYIRQKGILSSNICVFQTDRVYIRELTPDITEFITQPLCSYDKGSIKLAINNAYPQYYYNLYQGTTLINSVGPTILNDHTFNNLNGGNYNYEVLTDDGCKFTGNFTINSIPELKLTAALTKALNCTNGEITVYPSGGTMPYTFVVNGQPTMLSGNKISVPPPGGLYTITVKDANNCIATATVAVNEIYPPVYTVSHTGIKCFGDNNGTITFNVSNANGYTLGYSIDNGLTYSNNPNFVNLPSGSYIARIRYIINTATCISAGQDINITPASELIAFGGVSELAGCGPNGEGKLKVANANAGVLPYEYSFDNQATWTTDKEAYVMPGTYTLYVRDALGCIYAMPNIVLLPKPVEPTIEISDVTYDCLGYGTKEAVITNQETDQFAYTYLLNGVPNTSSNPKVFTNIPAGQHTISVQYQLINSPTSNELLYEDFGSGPATTTPGIASAYCFNDQRVNGPWPCGQRNLADNEYTVASDVWKSDDPYGTNAGAWYHYKDHTTNGADPKGRYLIVNIGSAAGPYGVLYTNYINDVIPNQDVKVEIYLGNLMTKKPGWANRADPDFIVQLVDSAGNVVSETSTGTIPKNEIWNLSKLSLNPGNNTSLKFVIRSGSVAYFGNDAVLDDFRVYQVPISCTTQVDFPFIVEDGNVFNAELITTKNISCAGDVDGSVTLSATYFDTVNGFQYAVNGGPWQNQTSSPFTISGLGSGDYEIVVRYGDTAPSACTFTFNTKINEPTSLSVMATTTPATCNSNSTLTVTGTGGSLPYTFELYDSAMNFLTNIPSNGILTDVAPGTYNVKLSDANGCASATSTTTVVISDVITPTGTISNVNYCYKASAGASIEVSASGGLMPYQYSISDGVTTSAFQNSNVFNNLTPGTYEVTIQDAAGCDIKLPVVTIADELQIDANLTGELNCTSSPEATISGTISNGYPPYTVNLIMGSGVVNVTGNNFTFTTATAGDYQLEVVDANGCKVNSNVITISPILPINATTSIQNPSCNSNADGSVQILPTGGKAPYLFSFNGSAFTTTSLYTNLAEGTYAFTITDANDCSFTDNVILAQPSALVVDATAPPFTCNTGNTIDNITITITVPTTGVSPYLYSFNTSGFTPSNTLTVAYTGADQVIKYAVQDANGCTATNSITIPALNRPTDIDFTFGALSCTNTTTSINVTATGGTLPLVYETLLGSQIVFPKQSSNTFNSLTDGTYIFRVTDVNGCYYDESVNIQKPEALQISAVILSDANCRGGNTGKIEYTLLNSSGTYDAVLTTGTGTPVKNGDTINLDNLVAGIYTLEVTDTGTGCIATSTLEIKEPDDNLLATTTATNINCFTDESEITINATGGVAPYTYAVVKTGDPAPTTFNSNHIISVDTNSGSDLNWSIYVKDANACVFVIHIQITSDSLPTVTASAVTNQCTATTAFTFTVTGAGGTPPYMYSLNGGMSYQTSDTFTVNTPGSFIIMVKDANGCIGSSTTTTDVYLPINADVKLVKDITCSAPTQANLEVSIFGGKPNFSYKVKVDSGAYGSAVAITGDVFNYNTNLPGTYVFEITDANGCSYETQPVTLTPANPPSVNAVNVLKQITCNGEETAQIEIILDTTPENSPYSINVYNTTTSKDYGTTTSNLAAGNYVISIIDNRGCYLNYPFYISEPNKLDVDYDTTPVTCGISGTEYGAIVINSTFGGTGLFSYYVTSGNGYSNSRLNVDGSSPETFNNLDFGIYEITIVDANGCTTRISDILIASPPDNLDIIVTTPPVDCTLGGSAKVKIGTSLSSSGPFHFAIYQGYGMTYSGLPIWHPESSPNSKEYLFTNLIPGASYTFIVYDEATDCYYFEPADTPIPTNSTLSVTNVVPNNITCKGSADGNVSFTVNSTYPTNTPIKYEIYEALSLGTTGITGVSLVPANGSVNLTNIGALDKGTYVIVVTEEAGGTNVACSVSSSRFNITESTLDLSLTAQVIKHENCNELGEISALAKDGTAPYNYLFLLASDPVPTAATSGWTASGTFVGATNNYIVYAKDANGCIKNYPITLNLEPTPTIAIIPTHCFDATPFTITVNEGSGLAIAPLTYSIGGAFVSTNTFTITRHDTYTVSIKDGNGCITSTTYEVNQQMLLDANITRDLSCDADARIGLLPTGGTATYILYEVSIDGGPYTTITPPYTTNTGGTYKFRVTDSENCIAVSNEVVVTPNTTPTFTYTKADVSCNAGNNGGINVVANNGISPYQYSIDNGTTWQNIGVFNGLSEGTYNVKIKDSKNCESPVTVVTINEPLEVTATGALTQGLTCGAGNTPDPAIITVSGSGGTTPYSYSIDGLNFTSTNVFTTFNVGNISVYVRDANGCISLEDIVNVPNTLNAPSDLDFTASTLTCLNPTSDVSLTVTDDYAPFTFEILSPTAVGPQSSNVFTALAPGTYLFKVTDANGCSYTEAYTISNLININVIGNLNESVTCFGETNGAVNFTITNFATTYRYELNSDGNEILGQTNNDLTLTGLSAGNQTILVTDDATGCTSSFTVMVPEPNALNLSETLNVKAHCNANAQVSVSASGGTPPYQYAFVEDGQVVNVADYSASGFKLLNPALNTNWDAWVKDAKGCITKIDVVIEIEALPTVTVPSLASNQCNLSGDPYTFQVTSSTGVGPFRYSIGNGFQTSDIFTVTSPGTYSVTIKDANGCENTMPNTITVYPFLNVNAVISTQPSCTNNDGVINVNGSGGSGSYSYSISPNPAGVTFASNAFSGVPAGNYTITIEDTTTLCTNTQTISLDTPAPVNFTTLATAVSCSGGSDGVITVNLPPSNTNSVYLYSLNGGTPQTSNVFGGLIAGVYDITVTSGRNCTLTQQETITEPPIITISTPTIIEYSCTAGTNASNFASITVESVTGGTGTYVIYEFIKAGVTLQRSPLNTYVETNYTGGDYTINVYDNLGCFGTTAAVLQPFVKLESINVTVNTAITCTNEEDITVVANTSGGTATLEYTLEEVSGLHPLQTNATGVFTALPIGNYIITVKNIDTNCILQKEHYISNPNSFDIEVSNVIDITCAGDVNGSATITFIDRVAIPVDKAGGFNYSITKLGALVTSGTSATAGPVTITGLNSGVYTIEGTLTNAPYCTVYKNFTITAPPTVLDLIVYPTRISCNGNDGSILASANGGWNSNYEYELKHKGGAVINAFSSNYQFIDLDAGDYTVSVKDSKGCIVATDVTLVNPTPINAIIDVDPSALLCHDDHEAIVSINTVTGGEGSNYTYTLNTLAPVVASSGPQLTPEFTGLGVGRYTVLVQDGLNCSFTSAEFEITAPTPVVAALRESVSQTCATDAVLEISATGGNPPYEYSKTNDFSTILGTFTSSSTFVVPIGNHSYYVRDANKCIALISNEVVILPIPELKINLDLSHAKVNCKGDATGAILASAIGGLGAYEYTLLNDLGLPIVGVSSNTTGEFRNLISGTYKIKVQSVDCEAITTAILIPEPAAPLAQTHVIKNSTCPGVNNGAITITATGGTGKMQYAISKYLDKFSDYPHFPNLAPGDYEAIVQDEAGCFISFEFKIIEPEEQLVELIPSSIVEEVCAGDANGSFSIDVSGGTMPYKVALDDIKGTYMLGTATQTRFTFTNLIGGPHTVFLSDANGCGTEWEIAFPSSVGFTPEAYVDYNCDSNVISNVVTVNLFDTKNADNSQFMYALNNGPYQKSNTFIDVPIGTGHFIDVKYSNGCTERTQLFDIKHYEPLSLSLEDGALNEIAYKITGGSGIYEVIINEEVHDVKNIYYIYKSGDYTITVKDSFGCMVSLTKHYEFIDICLSNYFTPNGDGKLDLWGPDCAEQYENITFDIFDRYGRKVATLLKGEKWDGKYQGQELPTGDYWYIVKLKDPKYSKDFVGHFTLYR